MRFCTSELKTAVICRELIRRFPGQTIVSACGIRREESTNRAKAPIAKPQAKLVSRKHSTSGLDWHPIIEWTETDVYAFLAARGFELHEGYRLWGMSRISCAFCIMGSVADIAASVSCPDNQVVYREMVALEITSTFAFQGSRWLGDVAPDLLTPELVAGMATVKARAARRQAAEARIPKHLLYTKGWPTVMPTLAEAAVIAEARREVAEAVGLEIRFTTAAAVRARFAELMAAAAAKAGGSVAIDDTDMDVELDAAA
jgi:hypothetical protein